MQTFTGKDYLRIDIANNFGLDKLNWDERISWFNQNEHQLFSIVKQAEEPALFYAGVLAWERAMQGKPSGYTISLDATASGIQILSVLAGDRKAAELCNVVPTDGRKDAYTEVYAKMVDKLGEEAKIKRSDAKDALMTAFYGSTAVPKEIFGEGELLSTFYETVVENAPGAWEINETLLALWNPEALSYDWILPDNYHVKIKVMDSVRENIHFNNEPFQISYKVNAPTPEGRSLSANMVHSIDGLIVREMQRRCNYDTDQIAELGKLIGVGAKGKSTNRSKDKLVMSLWYHFQKSGFLSARIIDYLDIDNLGLVNDWEIKNLLDSLPQKSFQMISVHDCFKCLPNYGNDLRRQYNNVLAAMANSDMLSFVTSQIVKRHIPVNKLDPNLGQDIRQSNYALS